jgi:hypothetical protein
MTWGFRLILFWSFFAVVFLVLALYASYQSANDKSQQSSRKSVPDEPNSQKRIDSQKQDRSEESKSPSEEKDYLLVSSKPQKVELPHSSYLELV